MKVHVGARAHRMRRRIVRNDANELLTPGREIPRIAGSWFRPGKGAYRASPEAVRSIDLIIPGISGGGRRGNALTRSEST